MRRTTATRGNTKDMVQFDAFGHIHIGTIKDTPRIDAVTTPAFGQALATFAEEHPGAHLLLNFHDVEYLTSSGLSEILRVRGLLSEGGGSVRVCALNEYLLSVFKVTNLDSLFLHHPKVREAAEAYNETLEQEG